MSLCFPWRQSRSRGPGLAGAFLFKFWQLYGGVNGDLLQEGVCHTQGCCTQSPCHSLLLTGTSTDAQTRFCLSLCGFPGFWCAQGLFEPSEHLWWEWGLILYFIPLTILLGLLLCPWTYGIFSQPLQHLTNIEAPAKNKSVILKIN